MSRRLKMFEEDHLHLLEKGAVQEQSLVVQGDLMFQSHKKQYQCKLKIFCFER